MSTTIFGEIHMRRNTAAYWATNNPVLDVGEPIWITDEKRFKVGDGGPFNSNPDYFESTSGGFGALQGTKYLESYTDLATALASIGSTPTELRLTTPANITTNTTIPETIMVVCEGSGSFNVSGGVTLTIKSFQDPGDRKVFTGSGVVRFGVGACRNLSLAWWAGLATGANITTTMWSGILQSLSANAGAGVDIPQVTGGYTSAIAEITLSSGDRFNGRGSAINAGGSGLTGSVIKCGVNNKPLFVIGSSTRGIQLTNFGIDCSGVTTPIGIQLKGQRPASNFNHRIANIDIYRGGYLVQRESKPG
ncbi:MAG: hypothetical protein ABI539_02365, partial [Acidobacteriota bacterium]